MDVREIKKRKRKVIEQYGEWTAHNIHLTGDLYTVDKENGNRGSRLKRIVQIVSDFAPKPLSELRVLDLGCHEGLFAVELARQGAEVTGVEGRKANIEKARFTKEVLSLDNLELIEDDVRNLTFKKYGEFDVVLNLGVLFHLDAPDCFRFVEKIAKVCRHFTVLDTHISLKPQQFYTYRNKKYWGMTRIEHTAEVPDELDAAKLWASLDNSRSFRFTRSSLYNLLYQVGFTTVCEQHTSKEVKSEVNRVLLIAVRGQPVKLISTPAINGSTEQVWPEKPTGEMI
jgi:2-polyprenyl-3-methyl-5-hydroxy-6-metoxy-1,4-benzoquinol methylase